MFTKSKSIKVLVPGGTGFIGAYIIDQLLSKGHYVVTTVRSEAKAQKIRDAYATIPDRLEIAIVPEIATENAFDEVIKIPEIEVVIHPASPCTMKFTDPKKEVVDPAVLGTTNILRAIKRDAPQVRRVIITSSISAMLNVKDPTAVFTETSWNPNDLSNIHDGRASAYMVSKTLAERAAWDFVEKEKPNFDLVTVNPPLVLGPVMPHLINVDTINLSNERLVELARGKWKEEIPPAGPVNLWIDVRDVAAAHIIAINKSEAQSQRLFTVGGRFSHAKIAEIMRANFSKFHDTAPSEEVIAKDASAGGFAIEYNCDTTNQILGIEYTPLERSIRDFFTSIQDINL